MIKLQPGNFSFKPKDKERETQKFNSVYGGPCIIVKIIANLSFKVQDKKTLRNVQVPFDRINKTQKKHLT